MWKLLSQWYFQLRENSAQKFALSVLDNYNEAILRRKVHNFYRNDKQPTLKTIHSKMCESTGCGGGVSSLRLVLRKMGFR